MSTLTRAQATTILRNLGWRIRTTAEFVQTVKNFQAGWNLGAALTVDGLVGPATSAALRASEDRRVKGLPTASAHFSWTEVRCRCDGKYSDCQRIWTRRKTFQMMESYRTKSARPLAVVSGCRCAGENKEVGGSPQSHHLDGLACDVAAVFPVSTVKSWRVATGIGYGSASGAVKHIDVRVDATVTNPDVFVDGK